MNYLSRNIALLCSKDPALAKALEETHAGRHYCAAPAKSGKPTLVRLKSGGGRTSLHSAYDPEKEAVRFIRSQNLDESMNYIVTGFGMGYHLLELVRRVPQKARILVFEKNPEILRLAFENQDLTALIRHPGFTIYPQLDSAGLRACLENVKTELAVNGYTAIAFKPLVETEREYYERLDATFQQVLQEAKINIKTRSAFSRLYYLNFLDNLSSFTASPGIGELEGKLEGVPAILVSAGPSLDKNMALLKTARNRALVIAVATTLRPLLSNGITPDFTAAIDADETSIRYFDLNSPESTYGLLYDPCLPSSIVQSHPGQQITFDSSQFLSEWVASLQGSKGQIGKSLSVAHTGYLFARSLGCDPIILVGQDLAFHNTRLHCRGSWFESQFLNTSGFDRPVAELRNVHFQKYRNAIKEVPDIFGGTTMTTTAMETYKNLFAGEFRDVRVYNATEGGSIIPGTNQISLREVLTRFCSRPQMETKAALLKSIRKHSPTPELAEGLKKNIVIFENWLIRVASIQEESADNNSEIFSKKMEIFYRDFLKEDEAVRLVQDYAYEGFLQWNRANHQITILEERTDPNQILALKNNRDREFLTLLLEALRGLAEMFKRAHRQIKTI